MKTETLSYHHDNTELEAFIAYPDNSDSPKPVVLIVHDWSGRNEFAEQKAQWIANMGYVGFALDMYGKGKRGTTTEEKMALMMPLVENRDTLRARLQCALSAATQLAAVDTQKAAIMGFCFGGLCALDLARSGADITGAISIHGLIQPTDSVSNNTIKAKVLALHGYADPMVTPEHVLAFAKEMTDANVDWQCHAYGNTLHAFTNPQASDTEMGTIYNPTAEKRALQSVENFLAECF